MAGTSGIGGNQPNQPIINLKNTGKNLDLNKLVGLRVTDMNASIFAGKYDLNGDGTINDTDKIDMNNDGIINQDEAVVLQNLLKKLAGKDNDATAKDFKNLNVEKADRNMYFNALGALADQQAGIYDNGTTYSEGNINIARWDDGTIYSVEEKVIDGETVVVKKFGEDCEFREITKKSGNKVSEQYAGDITIITERDANNNLVSYFKSDTDGTEYRTYNYQDNRMSSFLTYDGADESAPLKSVTLVDSEGYENQKITDIVSGENGQYTGKLNGEYVKFTISADGKVEMIGDNPVENNDANDSQPVDNGTTSYSIKKGDTLEKIARRYLSEQLSTEPTASQVYEYYTQIAQENDIKDVNRIYAGDTLNLPPVDGEKKEPEVSTDNPEVVNNDSAEEVIATTPNPNEEPVVTGVDKNPQVAPVEDVPTVTVVDNSPTTPVLKLAEKGTTYDVSKDEYYQCVEREIAAMDAEIEIIKARSSFYHIDVTRYEYRNSYNRKTIDFNDYKDTVGDWQHGKTYNVMTVNCRTFYDVTEVILSNGQPAYCIDGKYYALASNGKPDLSNEIILEQE